MKLKKAAKKKTAFVRGVKMNIGHLESKNLYSIEDRLNPFGKEFNVKKYANIYNKFLI